MVSYATDKLYHSSCHHAMPHARRVASSSAGARRNEHRADMVRRLAAMAEKLLVLGRNNPSLYTVNGRPLYVHLNGLAIVLLK
jgi:hypothetical protein